METERRNRIVLVAVLVVLAGVGYRAWRETSAAPAAASNPSGSASAGKRAQAPASDAPAVHLDALDQERPKPASAERNLFRYKPKVSAGTPATPRPSAPPPSTAAAPPVAAGPPPLAPITLKFIGVIDRGAGQPKIAVLTDGVGPPIQGIEGGTVAGKYRILRIGAESIEMAYLDGRGRQTIRLSGS